MQPPLQVLGFSLRLIVASPSIGRFAPNERPSIPSYPSSKGLSALDGCPVDFVSAMLQAHVCLAADCRFSAEIGHHTPLLPN